MKDADYLTGVRWSSAVHCERRAVYDGIEAPKDAVEPKLQQIFKRGHRWGRLIAEEIRDELADHGVTCIFEKEIQWPPDVEVGTAHADVYGSDGAIREIKSNAGAILNAEAAIQLSGLVLADPEAHAGFVVAVDSHTGERVDYPINVETHRERVEQIWTRVLVGMRTLKPEAMERAGETPDSQVCFSCAYRTHCWDGWVRPEPVEAYGLDGLIEELAQAEEEISKAKHDVSTERRDEIRAQLRPYLVPGEVVASGLVEVKVTETKPRKSFSLADMAKAGHSLPEELEPFVSESEPSDRWTVKRRKAA